MGKDLKPKSRDHRGSIRSLTRVTDRVEKFKEDISFSSSTEFLTKAAVKLREELEEVSFVRPNFRSADEIISDGKVEGCIEYAHVTAALAKSEDIPARIVTGVEEDTVKSLESLIRGKGDIPQLGSTHVVAECKTEVGWILVDPSRSRIDLYQASDLPKFQKKYIRISVKRKYGEEIRDFQDYNEKLRERVADKKGLTNKLQKIEGGEYWTENGERTKLNQKMKRFNDGISLSGLEYLYELLIELDQKIEEVEGELYSRSMEEVFEEESATESELAHLVASFSRHNRIPSRIVRGLKRGSEDEESLTEDVVTELRVNGKWLWFDPEYRVFHLPSGLFSEFRKKHNYVTMSIDSWNQGIKSKEDLEKHYKKMRNVK